MLKSLKFCIVSPDHAASCYSTWHHTTHASSSRFTVICMTSMHSAMRRILVFAVHVVLGRLCTVFRYVALQRCSCRRISVDSPCIAGHCIPPLQTRLILGAISCQRFTVQASQRLGALEDQSCNLSICVRLPQLPFGPGRLNVAFLKPESLTVLNRLVASPQPRTAWVLR